MGRPYDFYNLPYRTQMCIRQSEHDLRKARARAHRATSEATEAEGLREALVRTRAALRLLQPALNAMARECLDDIIAREIDATIGPE